MGWKSFGIAAGVLLCVVGVSAVLLWEEVGSVESEAVTPDVFVITGMGGNVGVLKTAAGAVVVDTMTFEMQGEAIREQAVALGGGPGGDAAAHLPDQTFDEELRIGGKTIRAIHLGRGHTDGDLVVLFVEDRVLHAGDLFFKARYPNIDLEAGGSIRAWTATLDRVLELDFDRVIRATDP